MSCHFRFLCSCRGVLCLSCSNVLTVQHPTSIWCQPGVWSLFILRFLCGCSKAKIWFKAVRFSQILANIILTNIVFWIVIKLFNLLYCYCLNMMVKVAVFMFNSVVKATSMFCLCSASHRNSYSFKVFTLEVSLKEPKNQHIMLLNAVSLTHECCCF